MIYYDITINNKIYYSIITIQYVSRILKEILDNENAKTEKMLAETLFILINWMF